MPCVDDLRLKYTLRCIQGCRHIFRPKRQGQGPMTTVKKRSDKRFAFVSKLTARADGLPEMTARVARNQATGLRGLPFKNGGEGVEAREGGTVNSPPFRFVFVYAVLFFGGVVIRIPKDGSWEHEMRETSAYSLYGGRFFSACSTLFVFCFRMFGYYIV